METENYEEQCSETDSLIFRRRHVFWVTLQLVPFCQLFCSVHVVKCLKEQAQSALAFDVFLCFCTAQVPSKERVLKLHFECNVMYCDVMTWWYDKKCSGMLSYRLGMKSAREKNTNGTIKPLVSPHFRCVISCMDYCSYYTTVTAEGGCGQTGLLPEGDQANRREILRNTAVYTTGEHSLK